MKTDEYIDEYADAFDNYQLQTAKTAKYPEVGEGTPLALAYVGLGLGEAGEVQGKIKKILRDDEGIVTDEKRSAIIDELGDVLWYVTRVADELGVSLSEVADRNLVKLFGRLERGTIGGSGDNR